MNQDLQSIWGIWDGRNKSSMKRLCLFSPNIRNHSFSMYATFSGKLKFLTLWHAHSQNKSTHCLYYIFLNAAEYIYSFLLKEWYFKNSFLLCVIPEWNNLDPDICISNVHDRSFKATLKFAKPETEVYLRKF